MINDGSIAKREGGRSKDGVLLLELFTSLMFFLLSLESFLPKFLQLFLLLFGELLHEEIFLMLHDFLVGPAILFQSHTLLFALLVLLVELLSGAVPQLFFPTGDFLTLLAFDDFACDLAISLGGIDDFLQGLVVPVTRLFLLTAFLLGVPGLALLKTTHEASAEVHVLATQELLLTQSLLLLSIPVQQQSLLLLEEVDGTAILRHPTHLSVQKTVRRSLCLLVFGTCSWRCILLENLHLALQSLFSLLLGLPAKTVCVLLLVLLDDFAIVPVVDVPLLLRQDVQSPMASHYKIITIKLGHSLAKDEGGVWIRVVVQWWWYFTDHSERRCLVMAASTRFRSSATSGTDWSCPLAVKERWMTCFWAAGLSQKSMRYSLSPLEMAGLKSKQRCSTSRLVPRGQRPRMVCPWQQVSKMGSSSRVRQKQRTSSTPRHSQSSSKVTFTLHFSCGAGVFTTQLVSLARELSPSWEQQCVWAMAMMQASSRYILIFIQYQSHQTHPTPSLTHCIMVRHENNP